MANEIVFRIQKDSSASESTESRMLADAINRLNDSLTKLTTATVQQTQETAEIAAASLGAGSFSNQSYIFQGPPHPDYSRSRQNDVEMMSRALKDFGNSIGTSLGVAVGVTGFRYFSNQATAIMGSASNYGNFIGAGISGNANSAFGNYVGTVLDIERQRQIANNTAIAEGVGGFAGKAVGSLGILGKNSGIPVVKGIGSLLDKAGNALAALGAGAGSEIVAKEKNQQIEKDMLVRKAIAMREADASIMEWKTPFARWGLNMTSTSLAPGVNVPLSGGFEQRYGNSQNYQQILQNIVPYLNANPLDKNKTGDLDKVAQSFLKAGFAAQDFSKLTMQSAQFSAITGKSLQDFASNILDSRRKFGEAFDTNTAQNQLNLMMYGYSQGDAAKLAYQAQFNPGMNASLGEFSNLSPQQFYTNQAISNAVGFDLFDTVKYGQIRDAKARAKIKKDIELVRSGKSKEYPTSLMILGATGHGLAQVSSWVTDPAAENTANNTAGTDVGLSPAQGMVSQDSTFANTIAHLQQMSVSARDVTISATNLHYGGHVNEGAVFASPPPAASRSYNPAKK